MDTHTTKKQAQHTPGALRAVNALILAEHTKAQRTDEALTVGEIAEIIDRETAAPDLLDALRYALPYVEHRARNPRSGVQVSSARADVDIIRAAIAKATLSPRPDSPAAGHV